MPLCSCLFIHPLSGTNIIFCCENTHRTTASPASYATSRTSVRFMATWSVRILHRLTLIHEKITGNLPDIYRSEPAASAEVEWTQKFGNAVRIKGVFGVSQSCHILVSPYVIIPLVLRWICYYCPTPRSGFPFFMTLMYKYSSELTLYLKCNWL